MNPSHDKVVLQINSLTVLERLIGGDSAVEVDIRNNIVQKFAEKHLKALANSSAMQTALDAIKQAITAEVSRQCEHEIATFTTNSWGSILNVTLKPPTIAAINSQVAGSVDTIIKEAADKIVSKMTSAEFEKLIQSRFDYFTKQFIDNIIRERLDNIKKQL